MTWFRKRKFTTLRPPSQRSRIPEGMWLKCSNCLEIITNKDWEENLKVCPRCGHHERIGARERIRQLVDPGSFEEYDAGLVSTDPLQFVDLKPYREHIEESRRKSGENDAIVCGMGRIETMPLSLGVMEFAFRGGSMGSVVGEKVARTLERGLEHRVPVLIVCASGGARMQEGILSLMQLAKTSALIARLGQAGLPYFVLLTHPSYAGIMASFGSLGDVILAEPEALIGFAGPRVIEQTIKQILPPGFQKSEFVQEHGFVDLVLPRKELRPTLARLMRFFGSEPATASETRPAETERASENSARIIESFGP
ncbi:MAG: Acetyl-coenzyme A carboxylase carboxyl transferase subunit beta [candidate division BRC1 bacterium ADurb.BinA292]|nr:MAG: Acetyl-coenzyme A carboxylase carboxyl transferase subunit beta [candidate division BRC1 bacterium ADurb.BinA292]